MKAESVSTAERVLNLLIVAGSANDAAVIGQAIDATGLSWDRFDAVTPDEFDAALKSDKWDAVIYGRGPAELSVSAAQNRLRAVDLDLPFIVADETLTHDAAAELLVAGVHDVVRCDKFSRLLPVICREIKHARARSEWREAIAALRRSEQRFRDFASIASHGVWETDTAHRITYLSDQSLQLLRIGEAAVIGKTRWAIAGATGAEPAWRAHLEDLAAHRPFQNFRYAAAIGGKPEQHFSVSGTPVFDRAGLFSGYRGTTSEVTIEVEATRALEIARTQLLDAIEALSDGFAIFDADDNLIVSNAKYSAALDGILVGDIGMPYETCLRQQILPNVKISDEHKNADAWVAWRLDRHRNPSGPLEIQSRSGNWIRILENRTREGGVVHVQTDITELKHAQASLSAAERYHGVAGSDASTSGSGAGASPAKHKGSRRAAAGYAYGKRRRWPPQALLTMLYRSTDCLCRCGAAVQNLAHSASLHSCEKIAPSKSGIKHLGNPPTSQAPRRRNSLALMPKAPTGKFRRASFSLRPVFSPGSTGRRRTRRCNR